MQKRGLIILFILFLAVSLVISTTYFVSAASQHNWSRGAHIDWRTLTGRDDICKSPLGYTMPDCCGSYPNWCFEKPSQSPYVMYPEAKQAYDYLLEQYKINPQGVSDTLWPYQKSRELSPGVGLLQQDQNTCNGQCESNDGWDECVNNCLEKIGYTEHFLHFEAINKAIAEARIDYYISQGAVASQQQPTQQTAQQQPQQAAQTKTTHTNPALGTLGKTQSKTSQPVPDTVKIKASKLVPRIGNVGAIAGKVEVQQADGSWKRISSGSAIYLNNHIRSDSKGRLQIVLRDQTMFTLGPNADMILDTFVYDPENPVKVTATIQSGVFRFVTGSVAAKDPEQMKVKVGNVGTIGIRGTDFIVDYDNETSEAVVYLNEGPISITLDGNNQTSEYSGGQVITFDSNMIKKLDTLDKDDWDSRTEDLEAKKASIHGEGLLVVAIVLGLLAAAAIIWSRVRITTGRIEHKTVDSQGKKKQHEK